MKTISLSSDLSFPLEVGTQTIAIVAKRRVGKSYFARRLAEQLFKAGQQIVIVDPKGDWHGIRSSRDGKSPGIPMLIIGGSRGDIPLEHGAGEVVAKLIVEERVSALLDLSDLRKHEVATFMAIFLETVYRLKNRDEYRTPLTVIVDEADAIAPQNPQQNEARMLGAIEDGVRRGGQRGLGFVCITQRTAVLNKNVLTQSQILVALRTIAPQDLKAMGAWIDVHGEPEQRKTLMASLPSLPIGDAWVWSPGWPTDAGIFKRIHTAPIETFDSGATPKPGERRVGPKTVADVDLAAVRARMAETIERAKADDPKALRTELSNARKRVAGLEVELERLKTAKPAGREKRVEIPVLRDKDVRALEVVSEKMMKAIAKSDAFIEALLGLSKELHRAAGVVHSAVGLARSPVPAPRVVLPPVPRAMAPALARAMNAYRAPNEHRAASSALPKQKPTNGHAASGSLPKGERLIIIAAAQHPDGVTREQLTLLTGYKRSTRDAYIQRASEKGFVEVRGDGAIICTSDGMTEVGQDFEPLPTGSALLAHYLEPGALPDGERKILEFVNVSGASDRDEIGEATGFKRSTRDAYLQRLGVRKLVIAHRDGSVGLSPLLFD